MFRGPACASEGCGVVPGAHTTRLMLFLPVQLMEILKTGKLYVRNRTNRYRRGSTIDDEDTRNDCAILCSNKNQMGIRPHEASNRLLINHQ